jgi:hypothetical protein
MALAFTHAVIGGDPGQPVVQLPSLLALYLCPRLNNSHQKSPIDKPRQYRGWLSFAVTS